MLQPTPESSQPPTYAETRTKPSPQQEFVFAPTREAPPSKLNPDQLNIMWVSDIPGWAYDSGYRGLKLALEGNPKIKLHTCFFRDAYFGRIPLRSYDVVLLWSWFEVDPPKIYWIILNQCDPDKTILCVASDRFTTHLSFEDMGPFKFYAGNNQQVTDAIKKTVLGATVHTLDYGVDLQRFTPRPLPSEFSVGWAGNPRAPLKRLAMAKSICSVAGVPLKVAGHPFKGGYVPSDDMPSWYHSISALLITSTSEVHPCVYYEALASGRPVVSTLVGDIPATAENNLNGLYLPVNASESDFVYAINFLKANPESIAYMGWCARRTVEEKWSWKRIASKYLSYAEEIMSARVSSPC